MEKLYFSQKLQGFVEKISGIYMILCSMFNIRTRHLKSKVYLYSETKKDYSNRTIILFHLYLTLFQLY